MFHYDEVLEQMTVTVVLSPHQREELAHYCTLYRREFRKSLSPEEVISEAIDSFLSERILWLSKNCDDLL